MWWRKEPEVVFCTPRRDMLECLAITVPAALLVGIVLAWGSMFFYVPWISDMLP